jgi:hypothetical protein
MNMRKKTAIGERLEEKNLKEKQTDVEGKIRRRR